MSATDTHTSYAFGPFRLHPEQRQLLRADGSSIALRGKAFDLLLYLLERNGELISKSDLLEALWPGIVVEENNLNQAVSAVRQALADDPKAPDYIATIKGRGYQFVAAVTAGEPATAESVPGQQSKPFFAYVLALLAVALVAVPILLWMRGEQQPLAAAAVLDNFADATLSLATDFPGSHSEPSLSPDGRMMAYVSDASGSPQIWVRNLQRGDPLQLTHADYPASSPSWSPGNDQILFTQIQAAGKSINSVGTLGSPTSTMVIENATAPHYSSGTNAFVYSRGKDIWYARNDGRDREKVLGVPVEQGFASREPALSPDGKLIAFIHAAEGPLGNLWVIPSAGGEARQLTTLETSGGYAGAPEWSPDGMSIVYSVEADMVGSQLWRINLESGEASALTTGSGGAIDASISSDGMRMAYTATRTLWQLTRIQPQTGETSTIHSSRAPILLPIASANGEQIVYFTRGPKGMHLALINNDGSEQRQLTFDDAGQNTLPAWGGDGESILYYRGRALHRLSLVDGSDTEVFADFHWSTRIWVAAFAEQISYHTVDRVSGTRQTSIREAGESTEVLLPVPIESVQWSADGRELLGWLRETGEILICDPLGAGCRKLEGVANGIYASYPKWSNDGLQIYYVRSALDKDCCALWRINVDGSNNQHIADLDGFETSNSYYGIDANGDIFYNHKDRSTDEIWLAETGGTDTE